MGNVSSIRAFTGRSRRLPGILAVVIFALGIGLASTVFAVLDAMFFKILPVPEPDRLVSIGGAAAPPGGDVLDWWGQSRSLSALALFSMGGASLSTSEGDPDRCSAAEVSKDFFSVLRVTPLVGRVFSTEDEQPGAVRTVVVTEQFAVRRLGDKAPIGQQIIVDTVPHRVIGVIRTEQRFPDGVDLWIARTHGVYPSLGASPSAMTPQIVVGLIGRLQPGMTLSQARSEMNTLHAQLKSYYAGNSVRFGSRVSVQQLSDRLISPYRVSLVSVGSLALLILVIEKGLLGFAALSCGEQREPVRRGIE